MRTSGLQMLYHLVSRRDRSGTHRQRLESFYRGQAQIYDRTREKLLAGRRELFEALIPSGFSGTWVDIGGGTGRAIEYVVHRLSPSARVVIVEPCVSMLEQARSRVKANKWQFVELMSCEVTEALSLAGRADVVSFSYSLSMMESWAAGLEAARCMLRPGGKLGVVDFSGAWPPAGLLERIAQRFMSRWFRFNGVLLSPDPHRKLEQSYRTQLSNVRTHRMSYVPGGKVSYYLFIGTT